MKWLSLLIDSFKVASKLEHMSSQAAASEAEQFINGHCDVTPENSRTPGISEVTEAAPAFYLGRLTTH